LEKQTKPFHHKKNLSQAAKSSHSRKDTSFKISNRINRAVLHLKNGIKFLRRRIQRKKYQATKRSKKGVENKGKTSAMRIKIRVGNTQECQRARKYHLRKYTCQTMNIMGKNRNLCVVPIHSKL
jgi:hypothetical protein